MNANAAILSALDRRNITRLLHFTPGFNLRGILAARAILPVKRLQARADIPFYRNDLHRNDGRTDCINLSLQQPNHRLFWHFRCQHWEQHEQERAITKEESMKTAWCILALDPTLCAAPKVNFTTTNAANHLAHWGQGIDGFDALFASATANTPANIQAEVLYPGDIALSAIRAICVANDHALMRFRWNLIRWGYNPSLLPLKVVPELFAYSA